MRHVRPDSGKAILTPCLADVFHVVVWAVIIMVVVVGFLMLLQGQHQHESYAGDRTKEALEAFADSLVPSAGQPELRHAQLKSAPQATGCNVAGEDCCMHATCVVFWGHCCYVATTPAFLASARVQVAESITSGAQQQQQCCSAAAYDSRNII